VRGGDWKSLIESFERLAAMRVSSPANRRTALPPRSSRTAPARAAILSIAILEYLDKMGATRGVGDARAVLRGG
jgi:hypothetical protein